jgi:hypothetical protein
MTQGTAEILSSAELMAEYRSKRLPIVTQKLQFEGVEGRDVYNITAPFEDDGELVIAGRVENRDTEYSDVLFFTCQDGTWRPRTSARVFRNLQDPFVTRIRGQLVFGGVEVWPNPIDPNRIEYRTAFYRGDNVEDLRLFAVGPQFMKDIRLIELPDGRLGVFTRPSGSGYGFGKIGFTTIGDFDDLTPWAIAHAPLIQNCFVDDEWGGPNELHLLSNGLIGVLGHIACFDSQGNRHYRSMVFSFDPVSRATSQIKVIASRDDFEPGAAKRPDLVDVLFSGGLVRRPDGMAELYAGVSDAEAHKAVIVDPFIEYEH